MSFFYNEKQLWTEPFSFSKKKSSGGNKGVKNTTSSQTLKRIEISEAGSYTLKLIHAKPQELNISSLKLSVRRNVTIVESKVYITGGVFFVLGLVGIFIANRKSKT